MCSYNEKDQQGIQVTEEEISKINERLLYYMFFHLWFILYRFEDMAAECEYVFNDLLTILSNKKAVSNNGYMN